LDNIGSLPFISWGDLNETFRLLFVYAHLQMRQVSLKVFKNKIPFIDRPFVSEGPSKDLVQGRFNTCSMAFGMEYDEPFAFGLNILTEKQSRNNIKRLTVKSPLR
jgi:hypothetical protein